MIGYLGFAASTIALLAASVGAAVAMRGPSALRLAWATRAASVAFLALLAANVLMVVGLVARDFSIGYVAQIGSRATPLLYTIASLWGALEGSILFWSLLLSAAGVLLVRRTAPIDRPLLPVSLAVLLGLLAFFLVIVVGPGNPWARVDPVPLDGPGPNPLLQNHPLMAVHPPLLYLGFVGLAVPYAVTIAALVAGRLDGRWLFVVRRWTLGPWIFLTLGLLAGAWWSYAVLGWGGYWAWDPVENVALLPWLTSTAFLHSAMVQARRGNLRVWNLVLVVASFLLTILATLVTRSGILNSVHSFTESLIGPLFLALFAALLVGTLGLAALRAPERPAGRPELGTRTGAFLLNNLLFVAVAATVLTGTLFPLFVEATSGSQVSVGTPYFERVIGPLVVALIVLVGIGPSLPWEGWDDEARKRLLPGASAAALAAVVVAGRAGRPELVLAAAAGMFALVQSIWYIVDRVVGRSAERRLTRTGLIGRLRAQRRALGGLVVHAAIGIIALAVAADGAGRIETLLSVRTGETASVGGDRIEFVGLRSLERPDRSIVVADVSVTGERTGRIEPALNWFRTAEQPIATPAIMAGPTTDLYVVMTAVDPATGAATFRIMLRPFVSWIWLAGALAALGGLLAFWPARRVSPRAAEPTLALPAQAAASDL